MNKLTHEEVQKKANVLKDIQDKLTPFLTFRLMKEALGYKSNSPVTNLLKRMVEMGFAEECHSDDEKRYHIL